MLLNVLAPGMGLLRLGSWRAALLWLVAPTVLILALTLVLAVIPVPGFSALAGIVGLFLLAFLLFLIAPAVLTWRRSRARSPASRP